MRNESHPSSRVLVGLRRAEDRRAREDKHGSLPERSNGVVLSGESRDRPRMVREDTEKGDVMRKEQALEIIKLLSALESWSFSTDIRIPDYLHEHLSNVIEALTEEVLK